MKTEAQIQNEIVKFFHNTYCLKHHNPRCCIFSCPNELAGNNKIATMQAKATGLMAGVSDLIVLLPNVALFVEVKTTEGRQSDKQKDFESIVTGLGFKYFLVRSLEDFQAIPYLESF